jgi:hypothetical protein
MIEKGINDAEALVEHVGDSALGQGFRRASGHFGVILKREDGNNAEKRSIV